MMKSRHNIFIEIYYMRGKAMKNRVIIAGSRDFNDYAKAAREIDRVLCDLEGEICIVSGHCRGADMLGERYAAEKGIETCIFPANWRAFGKAAGHIRNNEMARFAAEGKGSLIAFWDGMSRGTKNMIELAKKHGLNVNVVNTKEEKE